MLCRCNDWQHAVAEVITAAIHCFCMLLHAAAVALTLELETSHELVLGSPVASRKFSSLRQRDNHEHAKPIVHDAGLSIAHSMTEYSLESSCPSTQSPVLVAEEPGVVEEQLAVVLANQHHLKGRRMISPYQTQSQQAEKLVPHLELVPRRKYSRTHSMAT